MEIERSEQAGAQIFTPIGRIDSRTAAEFEESLLPNISSGLEKIIVDFSKLEFMSSAGLRVILMAAKRLKAKGFFALCGMSDNIKEVFVVSGFAKIITISDDLASALEEMGSGEPVGD